MGSSVRQLEYSKIRVMVVPYPAQGHINPMLQFVKRLVSKKLRVTFVMTEESREGMLEAEDASISSQEVQFETISDGLPLDFDRFKAIPRDGTGKFTDVIEIPGLPPLNVSDLPTVLQASNVYMFMQRLAMDQFDPLSEATWILGNSFGELESEEINSVKSIAPIRTVGPLLPSAFMDGQNPRNTDLSAANLWEDAKCTDWLNTKEPASVVYVSFGSSGILSKEQIHEIAVGLKSSGYSFIWIIRPPNTEDNLPEGFLKETCSQGLVLPWCSQLKVLSHVSVAAFMTHCGWNSTLESLALGVPMLAVPQWTDQTTNSKYIAEKWKTGLRLNKRSADGVVGKEEVEKCIRMVMETQLGVELRKNALRWKTLSTEAMLEGGSSDKNIQEFVEEIVGRATRSSLCA